MFGSKFKVSIVPKKLPKDYTLELLLDNLVQFMDNESQTGNMFRIGNVDVVAEAKGQDDKTNKLVVTEELEDVNGNNRYITTKTKITDASTFRKVVHGLFNWKNSLDENIVVSIELLSNQISVPLYIRKDKVAPPDTYEHLNLLKDTDKQAIRILNEEIFGE